MLYLVVSDFHLGKGKYLENGQVNDLEDFDQDEEFLEFLDHYSTGTYYFSDVHLILNGDILNLIQMDIDGVYTHIQTENHITNMVDEVIKGHPTFFNALGKFLGRPNKKVTYVIGNHDLGMIFEKAQDHFSQACSGEVSFTHQFCENTILVEHGHRFEPVNTVPRSKQVIEGPNGSQIINLPWASLFCIYLLPIFKGKRPHCDKIRPISLYVWWTFIHDFRFFIYAWFKIIIYVIRTQFPPYGRFNKNFKITLSQLSQIAIHPKYEANAKKILKIRDDITVVVMGHTHIMEWRKFKDGRLYFNSGTWNPVPSIDKAMHDNISSLSYVAIDVNEKKQVVKQASLNIWHGKWRPYKEVALSS